MIGTPIAFGLTMIVCFTLFYYYWRIRQLRARLLSAQTTLVQEDFPVEFGIGKNVVETFPTIKACELKCSASEDLQCPICLVEYEEWEVLRQLPFCGHIFHTLCVGAWFEKQTSCPVCRMSMSELAEPFGDYLAAENMQLQCRGSPSSDRTLEVISGASAPSWLMINRRLPLPASSVPAMTTEATRTCTCPSGQFLNETGITQPKTVSESVQLDALQRQGIVSADFHVVNIPQEEWRHTCSKCNRLTKPVKSVTSDDLVHSAGKPETYQQPAVQILVFQATVQRKAEDSHDLRRHEGESVNPEEIIRSQEAIGSDELAITQPLFSEPEVVVSSSKCDSNADYSSLSSADVKVQEDEQTVSALRKDQSVKVVLTFRETTL